MALISSRCPNLYCMVPDAAVEVIDTAGGVRQTFKKFSYVDFARQSRSILKEEDIEKVWLQMLENESIVKMINDQYINSGMIMIDTEHPPQPPPPPPPPKMSVAATTEVLPKPQLPAWDTQAPETIDSKDTPAQESTSLKTTEARYTPAAETTFSFEDRCPVIAGPRHTRPRGCRHHRRRDRG